MKIQGKPAIVAEEHLKYLDELRDSVVTNMYGAGSFLQEEFNLGRKDAHTVLKYWMNSFSERHPK